LSGHVPRDRATAPWHFTSLRTLAAEEWRGLLEAAETLGGPRGREPLCRGRRAAMVFYNSSLRTRTSFEIACFDLGAHAVYLQVGGGLWQLEHRDGVVMDGEAAEHVKEGIGALAQMVDAVGVRAFAGLKDAEADAQEPVLTAVVKASPVPVLNLESAFDHPHQGLADALTVRRRLGAERTKVVLTWLPHVKPLPMAVPNGALLAFAREGHEVVVAHPEGFDLHPGVLADARRLSRAAGGSVSVTHDRDAALSGARVVYGKAWGARSLYADLAAQAARQAALRAAWRVDGRTMARGDRAIFMHCLPLRRNLKVADEVLDAPTSAVLDQARARLDVQKATLCRAFGVRP
jgi:N-acetylornithine carbamoyltransferase